MSVVYYLPNLELSNAEAIKPASIAIVKPEQNIPSIQLATTHTEPHSSSAPSAPLAGNQLDSSAVEELSENSFSHRNGQLLRQSGEQEPLEPISVRQKTVEQDRQAVERQPLPVNRVPKSVGNSDLKINDSVIKPQVTAASNEPKSVVESAAQKPGGADSATNPPQSNPAPVGSVEVLPATGLPDTGDSLKEAQADRMIVKVQLPAIKSVNRSELRITDANNSTHRMLVALNESKYAATSRAERTEINARIRKEKFEPLIVQRIEDFTDVRGTQIGSFDKSSDQQSLPAAALELGREDKIASLHIDFAYVSPESVVRNLPLKQRRMLLRIGVNLTDEGQKTLETYIRRHLKKQSKIIARSQGRRHPKPVKAKSIAEVKRDMCYKRTYDLDISGTKVHANLRGKIEIFIPVNPEQFNLVPPKCFKGNCIDKINKYIRFANAKVWIGETSEEINKKIAGGVQALAIALREIL